MKSIKALFSIILIVALLFLAGCGNTEKPDSDITSSTPTVDEKELNLQILYCKNDTLNPFKTKNKSNLELSKLLYDSLFSLSDDFEPIYILAESITKEGKLCTVKLKNATFSNNTPVTAEDVIASYLLAKESNVYKHLFYNVKSVAQADSSTVVFELINGDPYFENLLTFPIIKKGSDQLRNEDNVEIEPIGSGRYLFSQNENCLLKNPYYKGEVKTDKIKLVDAPDSESVEHYVEIGATDFYYTDPENSIVRMSGKKMPLNMTNLTYLGVNHSYGALSSPEIRHAISSALDREIITKSAFYSYGKTANGFFHPHFKETSGYQSIQTTASTKISIENLEKIGYNRLDSDGYRVNSNGTPLSFSLLVNNSNSSRLDAAKLIAEQLKAVGIKLTVNAVSDSQYFDALSKGHFQLYLGEVKLTPNMDIGKIVLEGEPAAFGIKNATADDNATAVTDYSAIIRKYYKGESGITEVATALINDMPLVPLLYRDSLLFYSENLGDAEGASATDIFLSLNS